MNHFDIPSASAPVVLSIAPGRFFRSAQERTWNSELKEVKEQDTAEGAERIVGWVGLGWGIESPVQMEGRRALVLVPCIP